MAKDVWFGLKRYDTAWPLPRGGEGCEVAGPELGFRGEALSLCPGGCGCGELTRYFPV